MAVDNLHDLSAVNQWCLSKLTTPSLEAMETMYKICLLIVHEADTMKVKFYLRVFKISHFADISSAEKTTSLPDGDL